MILPRQWTRERPEPGWLNLLPHRALEKEKQEFPMSRSRSLDPAPITFLAINGGIGAGFGMVLAALLVLWDVDGLATLMRQSIGVGLGGMLFAVLFGTGFSGIAVATGVMLMSDAENPGCPTRCRATSRHPLARKPRRGGSGDAASSKITPIARGGPPLHSMAAFD
jgi:hypothetical protein